MSYFLFMKKGIAAILLTLYFVFSSGVVINLHYCMNRLDSARLGVSSTEMCSKCGMPTTDLNGCCHNEVKIIKLQDDQQAATLHFKFLKPIAEAVSTPVLPDQFILDTYNKFSSTTHSPPWHQQDKYLINCVFRI